MSEVLKIRLWFAWVAILLFVLGQIVYNVLFYGSTSYEIMRAYSNIDSQLSHYARIGKMIFAVCESACFVILTYILREIAIKNLALNIAYGLFFFLAFASFFDALFGQYYSVVGIEFEIGYAVSGIIISLIEYHRGKHS